jgi:hypothetical protein
MRRVVVDGTRQKISALQQLRQLCVVQETRRMRGFHAQELGADPTAHRA